MARKGTLTVRIVGDASGLNKVLGQTTGSLAKWAKVGVLGAAGAVATGIGASIKMFADFDQAMTESLAIMGDVSDSMRKDMSDAARQVAKTTKFSATEAAQSYFFLASAGMDAAASIEALPKVAAFAQAGAFDMARATDLLTDAQSALGMVVDDTARNIANLTRVSDVLVKANTLANASVEQFSEALTEKAGAALKQLNKDVEEGVAVLAVYADQGTKGSAAGVQLNAVLEGLTRTARLNADAYQDLGVAVFDTDGEMRHMADIIGDMEAGLQGMSTEAQLAELAQLGLTRTARDGVVQLLGSADAIREYDRSLRDAAGTTDSVASKQMETFWAKLGLVKDQLIDVALSVGQTLMPALEAFADWLSSNLPAITGWFDRISSKFTDLLGTGKGSTEELSGATNEWALDTIEAGDQAGWALERFGDRTKSAMDDAILEIWHFDENMNQIKDSTEDNADTMGAIFAAIGDAWKETWHSEIEPWLNDVMLPWFTDTAVPALLEAGKKAAGAFLEGLISELRSKLPGMLRDAVMSDFSPVVGPGRAAVRVLERFGVPTGNLPGFLRHTGGVVPGLPSQEVMMRLRGGEQVGTSGTRNQHPIGDGGLTIVVNAPNFVGSRQELMQVVKAELAKDARRGGTLVARTAAQ